MKTICFLNQKGGVGKTTSAVNIAAGLAKHGKRVLLVDIDPQGSATLSLGIKPGRTIYNALTGQTTAESLILKHNGYYILPANIELARLDADTRKRQNREKLLAEALEPIRKNFDYIIIDCPPSLGLLTVCGLNAATDLYIPLQPEILALHGLAQLFKTVKDVKEQMNPQLTLAGIIVTMYDGRKVLNRDIFATIKKQYPQAAFNTPIRNNIALAEAPGSGQDIFEYAPRSNGAADYKAICDEIIRRG